MGPLPILPFFLSGMLVIPFFYGCSTAKNITNSKRSAIEQQLISSSLYKMKEYLLSLDLKGKTCQLHFNVIFDEGGGSFQEGKYSIKGLFQREYVKNSSPRNNDIDLSSSTNAIRNFGIEYNGIGSYYSYDFPVRDEYFLKKSFLQWIILSGCKISKSLISEGPNQESETLSLDLIGRKENDGIVHILINVFSFGTVHSRSEWLLISNETLKFQFIIDISVIDNKLNAIYPSKIIGMQSKYDETYLFWQGPLFTINNVEKLDTKKLFPPLNPKPILKIERKLNINSK